MPLTDICDELKGRYPKDFKFVGWHPHCRCHVVTVLKTEEEMQQDTQRILAGEKPEKGSVNAVRDVPAAFKDWLEEHADRIEMGGNLPYFIKDNMAVVRPILALDKPIMIGNKEWTLRELISECRVEPTESGKIYVHPDHGKTELTENLDFAKWRAEQFGEEVILLPNPPHVKSADSYNITRGVSEEYKLNKTSSKGSIDNLLRSGKDQADYIILQIESDIRVGDLSDAIHDRISRANNFVELRLRIGNTEAIYPREKIIAKGFKIKPEDFHDVSVLRSRGTWLASNEVDSITDAKLAKFFRLNKKTLQEIATERHAARTPTDTTGKATGIEIKLSNNHTLNGVPLTDICDELKGRYPKDFKFVGWHPHCRCHVVTVLKTEEEMQQDTQRILAGEKPEKGSVNAVRDVPAAFKDWVEEHADRIEMGGNLPYFVKDNMAIVRPILSLDKIIKIGDKEWTLKELIAECEIEPTKNGKIYKHPLHGKTELSENLNFAKWRAEQFGEEVILLPNPQGQKSADSYNLTRGVQEEYKRSTEPTSNSISQLIRDGKKQADYLIVEMHSEMKVSDALNGITSRITDNTNPPRCTNIREIRLKVGDYEAVYTRSQIVTKGFKIKPEDFHNVSISRSLGSSLTAEAAGSISDAKLAKFFGLNKKTLQEIATERHAARTVEQAAAIQRAWNERRIANISKAVRDGLLPKECLTGLSILKQEEFNVRIAFLQKRASRHASRTTQEVADIKQRWAEKQLRDKHTRLMANNVLKLRAEYPRDVDFNRLEHFIATGNLDKMRAEAKNVAQAIKAIRDEEKALADLIPNAHGWHKQFSIAELEATKTNVLRTFAKKGWVWDINNANELDTLRRGLKHEVDWMGMKGKARYSTWEVAQSAYREKLSWAEKRIEMLAQKTAIENEIKLLRASRSSVGKQLVADFDSMFKSDATDISMLRLKAADIKAKAEQLEKTRAKVAAKAASSSSSMAIPFGGMTDEEAKKALIDFAHKIGTSIDPASIVVDNGYIHLQGDQHLYLYNALKAETPAEHKQLWTHDGGGGAHFGKGGYVRTGNSFQINSAFRKNGIFGNIDTANEALLRKAGMTPDDLKTIRLLDKKIDEFSLPVPILATRYVGLPALESIFGTRVTAMGTGATDASLKAWARAVKNIPRKNMSVDPAFLSASTNEWQNVFYHQHKVKLQIEVPPGTPMYFTDNYPESEIVLSRGTQLEFIGVEVMEMVGKWGNSYKHVTIRCRVKR